MSNVVAFPAMPLVGADMAPPLGVIVAPFGAEFVAWVRTAQGARILERTQHRQHAVEDGRAYAARHSVTFRFQGVPFRGGNPDFVRPRGGEISVTAGPRGTETWEIVHIPPARDSATTIDRAETSEAAAAKGRQIAKAMHASFREEGSEAPGPSAA